MSWNFLLNRQFTFRKNRRHHVLKQFDLFCASYLAGALFLSAVMVGLIIERSFLATIPLLAAVLEIIAGASLNYLFSRHVTFRLNLLQQQRKQSPVRAH